MEEEKKEQRQLWTTLPYRLLGTLLVIAGMFYFTGMETEAALANNASLLVDDFVFVDNGKVFATSCSDGKGGTAVYNPDKNTLTLTNYTFNPDPKETEPKEIRYHNLDTYYMGDDFTLILKGTNIIKRSPLQDNLGIHIINDCVIEGGGTLISNVMIFQYDRSKLTIRDCNIQIDSPYAGIAAGELVVENADISLKSAHSTITAWGNALRVEKLTVKESNITAITPESNFMSLWVSRRLQNDETNLAENPTEKIILSADEIVTDEAGNPLRIDELCYGGLSWYVYTAKSEAEFAMNPRKSVARCVKITSRTRSEWQAKIKAVEELIAGIGRVTIDSGTKIESARCAYEQLSEEEKKKVANAEILFQAETAYTQAKKKVEEALASHAKLSLDGFTFVNSGKFLASTCMDGKGGTAVYNPDKNTLTLTNYTFKADPRETEPESIIYYSLMIYGMGDDFTLVLKGTNTIQRNPPQDHAGIRIMDDCIIEGDGTLISNVMISQSDRKKLTIRDCNIQIDSPYAGIGAGELVVENADITVKSAHSIADAWGIALRVEKLTVTESNITAITPPSNCMSLWVSREINGNASDLVKDPAEKIILSADEMVTDEAGNPLRIEELSYGGRSWYVYTAKGEAEYAVNPRNSVARCVKITSRTHSERQAKIKAVEELIAGIGKVTIDSGTKIEATRHAYEQLSEEEKKKVGNAGLLSHAETAYTEIKKHAEAEAAKIKAVEELIAAIGRVTIDSGTKIEVARHAYEQLSKEEKEKVGNAGLLSQAETAYTEIKKQAEAEEKAEAETAKIKAVEELIAGIGKVTIDSGCRIEAARHAYEQLSKEEKEKVGNADLLSQAETAYTQVKKQAEEAKQQAEAEAKKKAEAEAAKKKAEEKTGVLSGTGGKTARTVKIKGRKYKIQTPRLKSVTSSSRRTVRAVWTTDRKNSGYQLVYSTSRKFKSKKTVWIRKARTGKLTLKKLKSHRTYYVKLRAYRTIKGRRYYSYWSAVGKRKVK